MANTDLGEFEGSEVTGTTIAIRNAGDGLSAAMKVDPQILHLNDTVFVVMECRVADVAFPPVKDAETKVTRKHVLRAGNATIVDGKLVRAALNEMASKIEKARDEESKAQRLDLDYDPLNPDAEKPKKASGVAAKSPAKKAPARKGAAKKAPAKRGGLDAVPPVE